MYRAERKGASAGARMPLLFFCVSTVCLAFLTAPAAAQDPGTPKYEFRGAWIATVLGLDWPARGVHPSFQITSLTNMLDDLQDAGINAVFFQVRSEADAMYDSSFEPWSYWLTGEQGAPPVPFYDPLSLVVEEAHKRGMELHAWFNPFRAIRGSGYTNADNHVTVEHPEWSLQFGSLVLLNPGLPEVRDHIANVITDVVSRYDIDGVHFDDFFYPYPPNEITNEDAATFAEHGRGFLDIADWRRDNVNLLIANVAEGIAAVRPTVKFGISPFGIWKNGVPPGIVGLDAANVIYGDATQWLSAQTVDYLIPQLYWAFGGGQDYAKLAPWWAEQIGGRHLYIGHGLYRSDSNTFSGSLFASTEIPRQVRFNRGDPGILGSVFFRARNITTYPSKGFADSLRTDLYRYPALTPIMDWKETTAPGKPENLAFEWTEQEELTLTWDRLVAADGEADTRRYAVYRVRSATQPDFATEIDDARNLIAVLGDTSLTDRPVVADDPYYYFVTAVSPNSIEGDPSPVVVVEGRAVALESDASIATVSLEQNFPNPFRRTTEIRYRLDETQSVTLRVYDLLGRLVDTIVDGEWRSPGTYSVVLDVRPTGRSFAGGTYLYTLDAGGQRVTKKMVILR